MGSYVFSGSMQSLANLESASHGAEPAREKMLNNEMDLIVTYVEEGFFNRERFGKLIKKPQHHSSTPRADIQPSQKDPVILHVLLSFCCLR